MSFGPAALAGAQAAGQIASGLSGGPSGAGGGSAVSGGNVFNTGPGHRQMRAAGGSGLGITPQTATIGLIVLALGVYVWNTPQ